MHFRGLLDRWRSQLNLWSAPDIIPVWAQRAVLIILVTATLGIRLAAIDNPPLERTFWKEIDYLMISENYWHGGYHFFWPEVTWPAEEPRATAMEFPLVPFAAAVGYSIVGQTPLSGRWPTLLAFTILGILVFLLVRREAGPIAGLAGAAAALVMPLWHEFGNLLYSDPAAICMGAASILLLQRWLDSERLADAILVTLVLGLTIALKVEMLYLGVCCTWMVWRQNRWNYRQYVPALVVAVSALAMAVPWYMYAYWLSQNSMDVFGLFGGIYGGHDKFQTMTMLSNPIWYGEMWVRISSVVLGGKIGIALALAGLFMMILSRSGGLVLAYLVAVLFYFAIVAEGQIDAPYRQLHAIPSLAALVGCGTLGLVALAIAILENIPATSFRWPYGIVTVLALTLVILMPLRRLNKIFYRDFSSINELQWQVAMKIQEIAGAGALIVTVGEYTIHKGGVDASPVLYRYAGARGWPLIGTNWSAADLDALRAKGATLIVGVNLHREPEVEKKMEGLIASYRLIYQGKDCIILSMEDSL